jgi:hypothetical protein
VNPDRRIVLLAQISSFLFMLVRLSGEEEQDIRVSAMVTREGNLGNSQFVGHPLKFIDYRKQSDVMDLQGSLMQALK